MQRDLVLIAVLFVLIIRAGDAEGKICPSMDIRNNPRFLENLRNCSIIMGHLQFVLMDAVVEESAFEKYSFPELTEIVDYLMVYRIARLTTFSKLFPNLRIIRGRKLFGDFSLIFYRMPDLQEIGLKSLQHIGQGAVMIRSCGKLCYANTVDWKALGAFHLNFQPESPGCKSEVCPEKCGGHCWNKDTCQRDSTDLCADFDNDGICVESCPGSKVANEDIKKCITREECETMSHGNWWLFQNKCISSCPILYNRDKNVEGGCVYAGRNYVRECEGGLVEKLDVLQELKYCTHINTSLALNITRSYLVPYLEECLGNIISISGYLKVSRSNVIRSLDFLKNLRVIKGEELANNKYALYVFQNNNLQKLWKFDENFNLTILKGSIRIHDNPQLCPSEIIKLEELVGSNADGDMDIFRYSNGYKSICNQKDMTVTILQNNPTNVTLTWQRTDSTSLETIIGYTIYYKPVLRGNTTSFDKKDECSIDGSYGVFVRENIVQLVNLIPFTRYGYYFKIYSTHPQGEKTPVYYFTTASTEPTAPIDFEAEATSDTSIVLTWEPPTLYNGNLSHYEIYLFAEEDYLPLLQQRDYCYFPHVEEIERPKVPKILEEEMNTTTTTTTTPTPTTNPNCTCDEEEKSFVQFVKDDLTCSEGRNKIDTCIRKIYHNEPIHFTGEIEKNSIRKREMGNDSVRPYSTFRVAGNETSYEFKDLHHFTVYVFYLTACNTRENSTEVLCGQSEMAFQRTKKRKDADVIKTVSVTIDGKDARVEWFEPEETNSIIVAYQIEYKKTDSEHPKPIAECITESEYQNLGREYKIFELTPAKYAIHVQAISLAGPGTFSEWVYFEISAEESEAFKIYTPILVILFFASVLGGVYYWYRKTRNIEVIHLITSINPDYAGPTYEEDHWEIDRNDIELVKELGQGSFGMVYEGMIKSRHYPCAIKTISENASFSSKMEFLNEGAVMKSFSDASHVIRLLGIVSRGDRPFVIMELMERGDLKSYLRRCREPSQNLTTNEMYRMSAEIADGMAYLAAKKFVHRDLAARNCMVAADRTVKVGDFGMARDIYETDYYRKETVGLLPVRWMAPESLADGVFTSDSDMWSYGVVLWEMATLAEQPYQGLSNEQVFHYVTSGRTLKRPPESPDLFYKIMSACWKWRPNDRPTFFSIVSELVNHVGESFRHAAFCFSRQGTELRLNAGPRVYNPPAMTTTSTADDEGFSRYDTADDEVSLYLKEPNRPTKYLPFSSQRMSKPSPYHISPGSPSSSTTSSTS